MADGTWDVELFNTNPNISNKMIIAAAKEVGLMADDLRAPRAILSPVGVAHPRTNAEWELLTSGSRGGDVRLRISTVGFASPASPVLTDNGVLMLHLLRPAGGLTREEWSTLLAVLAQPDEREMLARGEDPCGVRHFFFDTFPHSLQALHLLCQGYLVALVDPETAQPEVGDRPTREVCAEALSKMGWRGFLASKGPGYSLLCGALTSGEAETARAKMREEVRSPSFWEVFGAGEPADPVVRAEWGLKDQGGLATVLRLTACVRQRKAVPPRLAAEAYLALDRRLA
jgi:hypothetical protein